MTGYLLTCTKRALRLYKKSMCVCVYDRLLVDLYKACIEAVQSVMAVYSDTLDSATVNMFTVFKISQHHLTC